MKAISIIAIVSSLLLMSVASAQSISLSTNSSSPFIQEQKVSFIATVIDYPNATQSNFTFSSNDLDLSNILNNCNFSNAILNCSVVLSQTGNFTANVIYQLDNNVSNDLISSPLNFSVITPNSINTTTTSTIYYRYIGCEYCNSSVANTSTSSTSTSSTTVTSLSTSTDPTSQSTSILSSLSTIATTTILGTTTIPANATIHIPTALYYEIGAVIAIIIIAVLLAIFWGKGGNKDEPEASTLNILDLTKLNGESTEIKNGGDVQSKIISTTIQKNDKREKGIFRFFKQKKQEASIVPLAPIPLPPPPKPDPNIEKFAALTEQIQKLTEQLNKKEVHIKEPVKKSITKIKTQKSKKPEPKLEPKQTPKRKGPIEV